MKKGDKYYRELIRTENISTNRFTYFMVVCGVPRRISKADYDQYKQEADSLSCLSTQSTKKHRRQYTTCNYVM